MENELNSDFLDLIAALGDEGVEFLIVGAYAVAFHGIPRATGDLDVLIRPDRDNAARVWRALALFGAPMQDIGVAENDFARTDTVYQIGLPPRRIDILTSISGVDFDEAWSSRASSTIGDQVVHFIGRDALITNKLASGRDKDLLDVKNLRSRSSHGD